MNALPALIKLPPRLQDAIRYLRYAVAIGKPSRLQYLCYKTFNIVCIMASSTTNRPLKIRVSLSSLAKMIDHSLLHPTMTDKEVAAGLKISREYNVATACIKPFSIPQARDALAGSSVNICAVIGFPHGNSTTAVKVHEAAEAVKTGAQEVDMVVNVGKVLGGEWTYVEEEIAWVNEAVTKSGPQSG